MTVRLPSPGPEPDASQLAGAQATCFLTCFLPPCSTPQEEYQRMFSSRRQQRMQELQRQLKATTVPGFYPTQEELPGRGALLLELRSLKLLERQQLVRQQVESEQLLEIMPLQDRQYRTFVSRSHRSRVDMVRQYERGASDKMAERTQAMKDMRRQISGGGHGTAWRGGHHTNVFTCPDLL
jgi:hypothetical protein